MFMIKLLVLFSITLVTLDSVNGQIGMAHIVALLKHISDTSANMSATLPQLAALLKNQTDLQIVSNLLLKNNTAATDEITSILPQIRSFLQEQLARQDQMIDTQQDHNAASLSLFQSHQSTLDQIASTLTSTTTSDAQTEVTQTQMSETLTQIATSQTHMANTFNQMMETQQTQTDASLALLHSHQQSLDQITSSITNTTISQAQIVMTQTQMSKTLTQIATTQMQMVSLLQIQGQQLQNITSTMNSVVSVLENQQEILEDINRSLPLILDHQEKQLELSNLSISTSDNTPRGQHKQNSTATEISLLGNEAVNILQIQNQQIENLTKAVTSELHAQTQIVLLENSRLDCYNLYSRAYDSPPNPYTIGHWSNMYSLYCVPHVDGSGWITFQRRFDGSVNFFREWDDYESGFGRSDGEYWAGLSQIHEMTKSGNWQLRIDMEAFDGDTAYAVYDSFSVGDASTNFTLTIGTYSGTAGDALAYHNNMAFSTKDSDNDIYGGSCANVHKAGWWYTNCLHSNLNGLYLGPTGYSSTGNTWVGGWKDFQSLKSTEMKLRRVHQ